jgi:hypothetical protein
VFFLIPGAYDMRRGSPWRGWLTSTLSAFALLVGLAQLYMAWGLRIRVLAPGLVTGVATPDYVRALPFPTPPGLPDLKAVVSYHYWTIFWTYPYAKFFWTVVALAALTALGLHLARFRRIWSLYQRKSSPGS